MWPINSDPIIAVSAARLAIRCVYSFGLQKVASRLLRANFSSDSGRLLTISGMQFFGLGHAGLATCKGA